jgi:hypothetical protein
MPQGQILQLLGQNAEQLILGSYEEHHQVMAMAMLVTDFAIARPACLR